MTKWIYGASVVEEDGDYVVRVDDLPEVVTSGDTLEQALELAADAVEVAVAGRIEDEMELADPSPVRAGQHNVPLPARMAAKASIYSAWKRSGLRKTDLARLLHRNEVEVRRILDPRHGTKLDQLEETAKALGGRLVIEFQAA